MSAFLGPIHYWLYGKIGKQEELTKALAACAKNAGWIESESGFLKTLPPLETAIDENNIHGWLQAQINDAQTRYARLVRTILTPDAARIDALCKAAFDFGKQNAPQSGINAEAAYREFENFFVNGMPCDRVNAVTEESPDRVSWEMTQDIHAPFWNGDAEIYYTLRKSVMDGLLFDTNLKLQTPDSAHYTITTI